MPFGIHFDPVYFVGVVLGFLVGVTIHEFMHAYTAWYLGDDTARRLGRITLNPVAHFDPLGAFMFVLLALGVPIIAWGKPVPVNPAALRGGRRSMALVAFAGPASNVVLALLLGIPLRLNLAMPEVVGQVLGDMVYVNILMFCFNLIPVPPLDGYNIITGLLSNQWNVVLEPLRRYGPAILLGLVFLGPYVGINLFSRALSPVYSLVSTIVLGQS